MTSLGFMLLSWYKISCLHVVLISCNWSDYYVNKLNYNLLIEWSNFFFSNLWGAIKLSCGFNLGSLARHSVFVRRRNSNLSRLQSNRQQHLTRSNQKFDKDHYVSHFIRFNSTFVITLRHSKSTINVVQNSKFEKNVKVASYFAQHTCNLKILLI